MCARNDYAESWIAARVPQGRPRLPSCRCPASKEARHADLRAELGAGCGPVLALLLQPGQGRVGAGPCEGWLSLIDLRAAGPDRREARRGPPGRTVRLGCPHPPAPRRFRINPAATIARALIEAAVIARPGERIIGSAELS